MATTLENYPLYFKALSLDSLPTDEVIALSRDNKCLVGYINHVNDEFICSSETDTLTDITHFIQLPKISSVTVVLPNLNRDTVITINPKN